jgi:hypothetical protein
MSQTSVSIDPMSTECVLKNMSLAIDEIKLVRSINSISEQVEAKDAAQVESERRHYLISELRFLNKRLQTVREKAQLN